MVSNINNKYKKYENKDKSVIFTKNININNTIVFNKINNTLGPIAYFSPTNQEWNNSIYSYNNKIIPVLQNNLTNLLKNYFNMYFFNKILLNKRNIIKNREFNTNKIFFSKAELKHTAKKMIVTIYVYNEEKRIIIEKINRLRFNLFISSNNSLSNSFVNLNLINLNDKLSFLKKNNFYSWLNKISDFVNKKISIEDNLIETNSLNRYKIYIGNIIMACAKNKSFFNYHENIYNNYINKILLEKELMYISYLKLLLNLNKFKFNNYFLLQLALLISKIYNKKVEFNIVNLKSLHLNSDIFTQVVALKLKNRKNKLLRVLNKFLYMIKLSNTEKFAKTNIKNLWSNRVKNLFIKKLSSNNTDKLNKYLYFLFNKNNYISNNNLYKKNITKKNNLNFLLYKYIFDLVKYKYINGIRLETKGRLTKRFTASRSIFKMKWKGSLKNIDSSYKGLSSITLRGYIKPNIQYNLLNSKTRNGSFGVKGWISSK